MAVVAGWWSWRQRIRHRHFKHWWYMRLSTDSALECTRCHAVKLDDRPSHPTIPSSTELDIIKETPLSLTNPYLKAVVALVGAVAATVIQVFGPEGTAGQVATIVIVVLTALGVYQAPNRTVT